MELVLIAGASIGGLAFRGRAFAARHPALVAEQAVQLASVATRLTVQPNAVLASRRLDLSKPLEAGGVPLPAAALIRQRPDRSRVLFAEVGACPG